MILTSRQSRARQPLRPLLDQQPDIRVVGEASDGQDALRLALQVQPNVLLLDTGLPRLDAATVMRELARRAPDTRVIILAPEQEHRRVLQAIQAGAYSSSERRCR